MSGATAASSGVGLFDTAEAQPVNKKTEARQVRRIDLNFFAPYRCGARYDKGKGLSRHAETLVRGCRCERLGNQRFVELVVFSRGRVLGVVLGHRTSHEQCKFFRSFAVYRERAAPG